jgi:hypothetical protein
MKRLITQTTLAVALVLCLDGRSAVLPLAAAEQGSPKGRPFAENATVSFGAWQSEPPLDRFPPNNPTDRNRNDHVLLPNEAMIKAGGAVNFVISGFHQPIVYDVGTQPGDIDTRLTTTTTGPTPQPPVVLINDPTNRIYRGQDPSLQPDTRSTVTPPPFLQDRVEVVHFLNPGTYLVICGVQGHFLGTLNAMPPDPNPQPPMFGFVTVK